MHQSFATTSPSGPGNSGDIDFSLSKARVYAQHCRDTLMVKALPKSPLKSRQVNVNFHGHFGTGIKTPAIPRHCGDNAEVKTLQLSPAMPPLFPAPRGPWLQMTGALQHIKNIPMQYAYVHVHTFLKGVKIEKKKKNIFKNFEVFLVFAQAIDCAF